MKNRDLKDFGHFYIKDSNYYLNKKYRTLYALKFTTGDHLFLKIRGFYKHP